VPIFKVMMRLRHAWVSFAATVAVAAASHLTGSEAVAFLYVPVVLWAAYHRPAREAVTTAAMALGAEGAVRSLAGAGAGLALDLTALGGALASGIVAVSVLRAKNQMLTHTDALTGLPNRRGWDIAMVRESRRAARQAYPLTVVLLDVDEFSSYNAKRGHAAGDEMLQAVAAAWSTKLRATDLFARLGADEFGIGLTGSHDEGAIDMLDRIRREAPIGISLSCGVAEWDGEEGMEDLLKRARTALDSARRQGPAATVMAPRPTANALAR
jgi:diguanylate cyclase (GGDEF)-like protein